VRQRWVARELMDEVDGDPEELTRSLMDLQSVNRWLGGSRTAIRRLGPMIERVAADLSRPVRLVDVGTGSADLPLQLVSWSRARGIHLEVLATDLHPKTAAVARLATAGEPAIGVLQADGLRLPLADGSIDLALCSTALHHFDEGSATQLIRELNRVSRSGFLVSDLRRSRAAYLGVRILAETLWRRHPMTRHDGPVSVKAAFTPEELRSLVRSAGIDAAVVRTEPLFRLSLVVDRTREDRH
jgi:2-polyprenyl-3-methyl-5-hydroxy-6-metoxy-1,4-benzoquinol methylase